MSRIITRRRLISTGLVAGAGSLVAGCDKLGQNQTFRGFLDQGDKWNYALQRSLSTAQTLAPEFRPDQRSPIFRTNGTRNPNTAEYNALAANKFADWRLEVGGLVDQPLKLSLAELRAMPARSQITLHNCVEGWSAIGEWLGPQLKTILTAAKLKSAARFIVFYCADHYRGGPLPYYESIDLYDAFHPQTLMALELNGAPLDIGHGAPVRLRVERQLGYKHAKYVMRIEAVAALDHIQGGQGGFWEDAIGYDWYAGI